MIAQKFVRTFLFLQGVNSPFFSQLGLELLAQGHKVILINFNQGDRTYRRSLESFATKTFMHRFGAGDKLNLLLNAIYSEFRVTDQVIFGDRRTINVQAIAQADPFGVCTHVFEEGYFRPHWVTLEQGGVNARSALPKDVDWYERAAAELPSGIAEPQSFRAPFWLRAMHDVVYHAAGILNPLRYPGYQTHSLEAAPTEYLGYLKRFAHKSLRHQDDRKVLEDLLAQRKRFYFLPLQLDGDFQVRDHPSLPSMQALLQHVMKSFSKHAPSDTVLLIKNHPLDSGAVNLEKLVAAFAQQFDLHQRVLYLESGDLERITTHAAGTVTLNSTVGAVALSHGCATLALGEAIYSMPGLTDQNGLNNFWQSPTVPNLTGFHQFKKVVLATTQINGGFYSPEGIALAVKNSVSVLQAKQPPLQALLARVPR